MKVEFEPHTAYILLRNQIRSYSDCKNKMWLGRTTRKNPMETHCNTIVHELLHSIFPPCQISHIIHYILVNEHIKCYLFREKCSFLKDDIFRSKFLNDTINVTIAYKVLPHWKAYLGDSSENILEFIQRMIMALDVFTKPNLYSSVYLCKSTEYIRKLFE